MFLRRSPLFVGLLFSLAMLLSGCSVVVPRLVEAWFTVAPASVTPAPDAVPTPVEAAQLSPEVEQVVMKVKQVLVEQLQVDLDAVSLVSVEATEWPNGCLGLPAAGEMCTMMIVPGYRVSLEVEGRQYVFRTDADARSIRMQPTSAGGRDVPVQ